MLRVDKTLQIRGVATKMRALIPRKIRLRFARAAFRFDTPSCSLGWAAPQRIARRATASSHAGMLSPNRLRSSGRPGNQGDLEKSQPQRSNTRKRQRQESTTTSLCARGVRLRRRKTAQRCRCARDNSIVILSRSCFADIELLRGIRTNVPSLTLLQRAKNSCAKQANERDATHGESCEEIRCQEEGGQEGRREEGRAQGRGQEGRAQGRGQESRA